MTALFAGCAVMIWAISSQLNGVWYDKMFDKGPLKNTLIIADTDNFSNRKRFEMAFVDAIQKAGGKAGVSTTAFPSDTDLHKETIKQYMAANGFDSVLISRLISIDFATEYHPNQASDTLDDEVQSISNTAQAPSHFKKTTNVIIRSKIFDATGHLIWEAESETFGAGSIENLVQVIARAMGKDLRAKGLLL